MSRGGGGGRMRDNEEDGCARKQSFFCLPM